MNEGVKIKIFNRLLSLFQGTPLPSLNRIPACSLPLPPLVAQPDHTILVRVSNNNYNYYNNIIIPIILKGLIKKYPWGYSSEFVVEL